MGIGMEADIERKNELLNQVYWVTRAPCELLLITGGLR